MADFSNNSSTARTTPDVAASVDTDMANGARHHEILSHITLANLISNINLAQQNAVSNQQAMNQLGLTVLGKVVNMIENLSPLEAVAVTKLDTSNEVAEQIADLKAALGSINGAPAQTDAK